MRKGGSWQVVLGVEQIMRGQKGKNAGRNRKCRQDADVEQAQWDHAWAAPSAKGKA